MRKKAKLSIVVICILLSLYLTLFSTDDAKVFSQSSSSNSASVSSINDFAYLIKHDSNNYTLYSSSVAINVVWDGTYAYCRLLNNTESIPWQTYPISYWTMWHFEFLGAGDKWKEDVPSNCQFSNAIQNSTEAFLTQTLILPSTGSSVQITYKVLAVSGRLKWNIKFISGQSLTWRFRYRLDGIPSQHIKLETAKNIIFSFSERYNLTFAYDDVPTQYAVSDVYDETNHKFYFDISVGTINAGQIVSIDPSLIGTSDIVTATSYPFQHKTFYSNGRHWAFYTNSTDFLYSSSTDGSTWTSPQTIREEPNMATGTSIRYFTSTSKRVNNITGYWLSTEQSGTSSYNSISTYTESNKYVDSLDNSYTGWTTAGTSPYLQDNDYVNYIYTSTSGVRHGNFSFADFTESGTITTVKLVFLAKSSNGLYQNHLYCSVYNGTTWSNDLDVGAITSTSYSTYTLDITNISSSWTWANLNNTKMNMLSSLEGGTLYVTAAYLSVAYYASSADWGITVHYARFDNTTSEWDSSSYKAVVTRTAFDEGLQNATWTGTTAISVNVSVSLLVKVYVRVPSSTGTWTLLQTFVTKQLEASSIINSTWTVYYYTKLTSTTAEFYFGSSTYNSRIENFQITPRTIYGYEFSVALYGNYVHWAIIRARQVYETPLIYRRGLLNSDGSISWTDEQIAVPPSTTLYFYQLYPSIAVDSNGYPFIGYCYYDGSGNYPFVTKSSTNDGTWSTASTFPYKLYSFTCLAGYAVSIIPLTNGKVYALFTPKSAMYGCLWNGTAWSATETAYSLSLASISYFSAVNCLDDVHLVFLNGTTYEVLYLKRTYSSGTWSGATTLVSGATSTSAPVISVDSNTGDLYVFAATKTTNSPSGWTAEHIYYIKYDSNSGSWRSWVDWINLPGYSLSLYSADTLTCSYQAYNNYIGLVYMTNIASPYNIQFDYLTVISNQAPTIGGFQAPTIVYANQYFFLNATINDADGIAQFVNATIEINGTIILKWDNITGFSEYNDTNNYCTLDTANSIKTNLNTTAHKLSFKIKLGWNYSEGNISVSVTNTKCFDNQGASGSNSYANLFYFENDLIVYSASVNDNRINPSQSITFSGTLYYEGTTIPPEDVSGITAKVDLGTTNKGSNTTINTNGSFSISFTGEGTVGSYSYTVYCVTVRNSVQNQTISVIVDRMKIVLKGANDTRVDVNAGSRVYFNATWEYDNALFQGSNGTLYINATAGTWDSTNKYWYIDVTQSSVEAWVYQVSSVTDNVYGISTLNDVVGTQQVVWDRAKVESSGALSNRINNGASTIVYFVLKYEYDSALITDGTVTINGTSATYNATSQRWELTVSNSAIAKNAYYVSSVSGNTYGITVINHIASYPAIIFDKDKMDSFAYSGGTLANMTFRLLSEYYSNTLNNTNLTLNVYLNDSLLDSISAISNDTGLVFVSLTHNIYCNGTLTFNLTDGDGVISYSYSCPVEVYVESIEVFSIDPMILYTGDSLTITMYYKPKANINGTYLTLSNVYWKALIYTDKYYGYYNFNLYNGSFANALEPRVELMPITLSEGSYMLNMTFYIKGSDTFLGSATTPYFVVKAHPSSSGGAPSTVIKLPLTVIVKDYKGGYAQGVHVVVIDQYNATVWEGTTDNWGTIMATLNPGTYNVTIQYNSETLSDVVTLSNEPITKEFTLPGLAITPVTVTLDSYSILWLGIGLAGAVGAVILERKEKTSFAIVLGLVTVGSVLHSLLVITHQMPPYFTVPQFDFSSFTTLPSFSLPSFSLSQINLDMQTITFIAVGITVPVVIAYAISQRGGTHKRRVRVGKFGEERRKRVWK